MSRGFPLQDTGPGMNELFHDLQIEQEQDRWRKASEKAKAAVDRVNEDAKIDPADHREVSLTMTQGSSSFNDKHLLWWVLKALETGDVDSEALLRGHIWKNIDAPDWVFPAIQEKIADFRKR